MKSWFEAESAAAGSRAEFVPFTSAAGEFVLVASLGIGVQGRSPSRSLAEEAAAESQVRVEANLAAAYERGLGDARAQQAERDSIAAARALGVLGEAASEFEVSAQRQATQWSSAAIDLALAIAERIVRSSISVDREAFEARVAAAFENLSSPRGARLFVGAADLSWLEARESAALEALREARALAIESDPALEAGEFRLEHQGALVDGRVDAMLERFREELIDPSLESGGDA